METVTKQEIDPQSHAIKSKVDHKKKPIRIATTSQSTEQHDEGQQLVHIAPNQIQMAQIQTLEGVQGNTTLRLC